MTITEILKYLLEGLAVATAAFVIPQRKTEATEIACIALTAAAVFMVLDAFSPSIGASARQGSGFGIGLNQVGWGPNGKMDEMNRADDMPFLDDAPSKERELYRRALKSLSGEMLESEFRRIQKMPEKLRTAYLQHLAEGPEQPKKQGEYQKGERRNRREDPMY
jgi:hypothetical protein